MKFTIDKRFHTEVERTDRVLEIAEAFGLGLDDKEFVVFDNQDCAKLGFRLPALATPLTLVPKTFHRALADPNWWAVMDEEHVAILRNNT